MSFDIKYDAEGKVVSTTFKNQPEELPEQVSEETVRTETTRDETSHVAEQVEGVQVNSESELETTDEPLIEAPKERNMRILREAKEFSDRERQRMEKERDDAIRRSEDLERRYKKPEQVPVDNDDFQIGEDDLAEGKHLKKVYNEVQALKKQVEYYKNNSQSQNLEARIRSDFPDFASVVTPDNITILKSLKPRQSALLDQSTDMYETAATAYEMIKEYVMPPEDKYVQQKQVAQRNAAKPKPVASLSPQQGDSPLSKANAFANGFTPELAKQLREEMNAIRKAH